MVRGDAMGIDDKINDILARQARAIQRLEEEKLAAYAAAERAKELRHEVSRRWKQQSSNLETFIERLDQLFSKNGVHLYMRNEGPRISSTAIEVGRFEVAFDRQFDARKRLAVSVHANGEAHIYIADGSESAKKTSTLNVLEATDEQLQHSVLDFVDLNTPK
jgi:hypothetical protein